MLSFSVWRTLRFAVKKTLRPELAVIARCCSTWSRSFVPRSSWHTKCATVKCPATVRSASDSADTAAEPRWWMDLGEDRNQGERTERKSMKVSGSRMLYDFKQKVLAASSWQWTDHDWEEFESEVLSEKESLSRIWEAVSMNLMYHKGFLDGGLSLIEYIRSKGRSPNLATLTVLVALCGEYGGKSKQHLVFKCYEELLKISPLFDSQSCKYLIIGLCGTDRWREAIPFLEMSRLSQEPKGSFYSPIAVAAFRNGDIETALGTLAEVGDNCLELHPKALLAFIEACGSDGNKLSFQTLFEYLRKYSWFPSAEMMRSLIRTCRSSKHSRDWHFTFTRKDNRGVCKACGHQSQEADLSEEQFQNLQQNFLDKAVISKDIFLKTSPTEMKAFLDFVKDTAPYDVVLDALNIAFRRTSQQPPSSKRKMEMVRSVVDYFWRKDRRVMVLGRKHMMSWSARDMAAIRSKAHCFFAENISQDDPFLLYAALWSGPDTVFVSNDEMRDHKYMLGQKLGSIFKQWQRSRQIYFLGTDYRTQRLKFLMPKSYDTLAQEDDRGWHIPYENQVERMSFQHPNAWLCIRQKH